MCRSNFVHSMVFKKKHTTFIFTLRKKSRTHLL
jgi:hypothetical protein